MDLQVAGLEELEDRVETALDRIAELQMGVRMQSDAFFSQPFMDDHTDFKSFTAFCEKSPWALEENREIQDVSRKALNEYVAARTDFETWEEMKTCAAQERIIEQIQS